MTDSISNGADEPRPATGRGRPIDRRTVVRGTAWSIPVIAAAAAVPAQAASASCPTLGYYWGNSVRSHFTNLAADNKTWIAGSSSGTIFVGLGNATPGGNPAFAFASPEPLTFDLLSLSQTYGLPYAVDWTSVGPGWTLTSSTTAGGRWIYVFTYTEVPSSTSVTSGAAPGTTIVPTSTASGTIVPSSIPDRTDLSTYDTYDSEIDASYVYHLSQSQTCPTNNQVRTKHDRQTNPMPFTTSNPVTCPVISHSSGMDVGATFGNLAGGGIWQAGSTGSVVMHLGNTLPGGSPALGLYASAPMSVDVTALSYRVTLPYRVTWTSVPGWTWSYVGGTFASGYEYVFTLVSGLPVSANVTAQSYPGTTVVPPSSAFTGTIDPTSIPTGSQVSGFSAGNGLRATFQATRSYMPTFSGAYAGCEDTSGGSGVSRTTRGGVTTVTVA